MGYSASQCCSDDRLKKATRKHYILISNLAFELALCYREEGELATREERTVTSLPTSFLLGPEMADFGLSVAGFAMAEGDAEFKIAVPALLKSIVAVRAAFDAARSEFRNFDTSVEQLHDGSFADLLDRFAALEGAFANGANQVRRLLSPRFQSVLVAFGEGRVTKEASTFAMTFIRITSPPFGGSEWWGSDQFSDGRRREGRVAPLWILTSKNASCRDHRRRRIVGRKPPT
jgi:hypothetical protein